MGIKARRYADILAGAPEYVTGRLLRSLRACPWDYTGCRFSVDGLIRLDFAPLWFGAGLWFERITQGKDPVNPA